MSAPLASGLALAAVLAVCNPFASSANARDASAAPATGAELFGKRCGLCHFEGGTGTFMLARRLGKDSSLLTGRRDLTADYIRQVVRHGLMSMPRLNRVELPDSELEAITAYLTTR
jgi:mono/diheme cytochrome c family protein